MWMKGIRLIPSPNNHWSGREASSVRRMALPWRAHRALMRILQRRR
jgi:hypothetical protein